MVAMKKLALVLLMSFGCGGSASTALDRVVDDAGQVDTGREASEIAVDSGTVVVDSAATDLADTAVDSITTIDSSVLEVVADSAPTCTHFDGGTVEFNLIEMPSGTVETCSIQIPSQFSSSTSFCGPEPTPAACQCVETYTCACLGNPLGCINFGCNMEYGVVNFFCS